MNPPALQIRNLSKSFGPVSAVDQLSLSIPQGQFYGLLGPNGAGKTTTLRMVAGLLKPDRGDIRILGNDIVQQPRSAKQHLAYLPEEPLLYDKLRPLEYLAFVAGLWGMDDAHAARRAEELLRDLSLWDLRGQLTDTLSRGQRQKLALAGALIHEPRLLILDEPLTGLDASAARLVKDLLLDWVAAGATVVLTTHLLDVAERLVEQLGIIAGGRVLAEGSLETLRDRSGQQGSLESVFLDLVEGAPS